MRLFVSFKKGTNLAAKLMVFQNLTRNQVQDLLNQSYSEYWHKIYTEQEASVLLYMFYSNTNNWVKYGEECFKVYADTEVSVQPITDWFKTAKPNPTDKDLATQTAAHFEEVAELIEVFAKNNKNTDLQTKANAAYIALKSLTSYMYTLGKLPELSQEENVAILDALADQVVTGTGIAYFAGYQFDKALTEVNKSNYSKLEDGKPVLNSDGKIMKGKDYFKPDLTNFV